MTTNSDSQAASEATARDRPPVVTATTSAGPESVAADITSADEFAFAEMVAAELPVVTAYARRRVRDPDDVVSEVFATAWRHRHRLPDPVRPWLLRVASHHVLHADRSEMRRRALVARTAGYRDLPHHADHADATVERIEARSRVEAALARLRPLDREVLRLSAWEQLPTADIAAVLDCSVTAAKVRLHRARSRFAAALDLQPDHRPAEDRPAIHRPAEDRPAEDGQPHHHQPDDAPHPVAPHAHTTREATS